MQWAKMQPLLSNPYKRNGAHALHATIVPLGHKENGFKWEWPESIAVNPHFFTRASERFPSMSQDERKAAGAEVFVDTTIGPNRRAGRTKKARRLACPAALVPALPNALPCPARAAGRLS